MKVGKIACMSLVLIALFTSLMVLAVALLGTETGSRWLLNRAISYAPGELDLERFQGSLISTFTAYNLRYRREEKELQVQRLSVRWRPASLLSGALDIRVLRLEGVEYKGAQADPHPTDEGFTLPRSIRPPVAVRLKEARVERIKFQIGHDQHTLDHLQVSAHTEDDKIKLDRFEVGAAGGSMVLQGESSTEFPYPFTASLSWSAELPEGVQAHGEGEVQGDSQHVRIEHRLTHPAMVDVKARVTFDSRGPEFTLNGNWQDLHWPLTGKTAYESKRGNIGLTGQADSYRLSLDGLFGGNELPPMHIIATGHGDLKSFQVKRLRVKTLGGNVAINGRAVWQPEPSWDLKVRATDIDPGIQFPEWQGKLALNATTRGRIKRGTPEIALRVAGLHGSLREHAIQAVADVTLRGQRLDVDQLALWSGGNRVHLNGSVDRQLDLNIAVTAPRLSALWPGLEGQLRGRGRLFGARSRPAATLSFKGQQIGFQDYSLKSLSIDAAVDPQPGRYSSATIQLQNLKVGEALLTRVIANGAGRLDDHKIRAAIESQDARATVRLSGNYNKERWMLDLGWAELSSDEYGRWRLADPTKIELSPSYAKLAQTCLEQGEARICGLGSWRQGKVWGARASTQAFPLQAVASLLPKELVFSGPVNVDLEASDSGGGINARIDARSNRGTVVYRPPGSKPLESDYQDFTLSATYANDVARADFSVNSDHGGTAAYVEIANVSGESPIRPIIGHIDVDIPDIAFVNAFLPDFEGIQGRLAIDADLDGDLNAPRVYGQVRLRDGLARLPELGLELRGINLTAYSRGSDRLVLRGEAHSGKGSLDVAGELGLNPQAGWPLEMHIMGKDFQVVRLPEAQAVASPDLLVQGEHGRIEVTGNVMLPEAVLEFEELPNSAISPSPDQVILSSPGDGATRKKPKDLAITSRVDVMLGEDVTFSGFGLETQLIGDLELRSRPGKPPTASGAITLKKGSYKAYGQDLTIRRGRFLFRGPVDNPSLDIRAIRKSGTVTAGIAVTGTLKDPRTTVFSEPPMSDADALAYLLTGKPLSEASSSEGDAIEGAALSMGLKAAVPITARMAQALGLDELSMKSDGGFEKTSLLVGKYLSPDLYVSYVRGLFDKLDTFKLKYQFTEHISVEAESGTSQGADLVYRIERD